ncbi:RNA polymerase sigma factor [Flavobacterium sp. ASW18X]|uniref:RNA polymerase sigma factor n=1 Tax=Flavobacterium sp. ASW18X TaxID=2572595 RepID=UPI0010AE0AE9|nr:RNA polymerase sigma factor [Flavobacterium sp. ASW18X]TKD67298.1 RNA polymerase sigma factor [Flavobacterium sp. ASW18X]
MKTTTNNNLSQFFKEEYHSLKGYVRSKIDDTADSNAEDILQEVALKVLSRAEDAVPINNIAAYVYNAIRNKIIDVLRTRKEKQYDEDRVAELWEEFSALFYSDEPESQRPELEQTLKDALVQLKPVYRDIIIAVDFEGYSYREIATQTGIAQGTLMSRRHRALSHLHKQLNKK